MSETHTENYLETVQFPHAEIIRNPEDDSIIAFPLSALLNGDGNLQAIHVFSSSDASWTVVNRGRITGNAKDNGKLYVFNRKKDGEKYTAKPIDHTLVLETVFTIGDDFIFEANKAEIQKITAVYTENQQTESRRTRRLEQDKNPENYQVSNDDSKLVNMMLYPDEGRWSFYGRLVESSHNSEGWDSPELQRKAQRGMRRLFETALYPYELTPGGVVEARAELENLQKDEDKSDWLNKRGIHMEYQGFSSQKDLQFSGSFLHFGVGYTYANEPDVLESMMRVYVTPKKEHIGNVAAAVISRAVLQGFMPCGKVWDDTTAVETDNRSDRMLFYVRTASQLNIVLNALREVQQEHPEAFEEAPPLLTEKTDISGVGLGEEPRSGVSFNQARVEIIQKAWEKTLELFAEPKPAHPTNDDIYIGKGGVILEKRLYRLRERAAREPQLMQHMIADFRREVQKLAASYDISPQNFAHNL